MGANVNHKSKYVGLIPAAGRATRLKNLACSKEIYPLRLRNRGGQEKIMPVCEYLIDSYRIANIDEIYTIIRVGKEDIPEQLGDGKHYGITIKYLYTENFYGPAYTLDRAYLLIQNRYVALGFPDILFTPRHAFKSLIEKQQQTGADVVLGLFHAPYPEKMDMVKLGHSGKIESITIKPKKTTLRWTWILAVWSPVFSKFMHHGLIELQKEFDDKKRSECHVGTVFQLALREDITFDYVLFNQGELIDIGTPEDLDVINQSCPAWLVA